MQNDLEKNFIDFLARTKGEVLEDCVFELDEMRDMLLPQAPRILGDVESLSLLETHPKSIARYGDGEASIMLGRNIGFQEYDPLLAEKLFHVLKTKRNDMYIGVNSNYFHAVRQNTTEQSRKFAHLNFTWLRNFYIKHTNSEIEYLSAHPFVGYFKNITEGYDAIIDRRKKLFAGRKVSVVTGESVLAKLDYDVFEMAESKQYIQAPSKNAFSEYDSILRNIADNVSKDTLICLILGPTASVMAADLTDMGYMAWDIGHMAKDYDAFMKKLDKTSETIRDFYAPD